MKAPPAKTITLQIGNTDDKLTQEEWSDFCDTIDRAVNRFSPTVHFSGSPSSQAKKQNACWVFDIDEEEELRELITRIRVEYHQDSAAWTLGRTEFI